jgi:ribulose-phosphate 3-epimerase
MVSICPTVLASTIEEYNTQIKRVSFASRLQLDFMDGDFAPTKSIDLKDAWWPPSVQADLHLMYRRPMDHLDTILRLRPGLIIIHAEADVHHMHFAAELHKEGIKTGLCVLPETPIANVEQILNSFDHLLIFGGNLGHFGGQADLGQLHKVKEAKEHHPDLEFGWDGGANDQNAKQLAEAGIHAINVGGFIQKAENPQQAYETLVNLVS